MILMGGVYNGYHTQPNITFPTLGVLYVPRWDRPEQYIAFYRRSERDESFYESIGFGIPEDSEDGWYLPCKAFSHNVYPVADIRQDEDWHNAVVAAMIAHSKWNYRQMMRDRLYRAEKERRRLAAEKRRHNAYLRVRQRQVRETRATAREMAANIDAFCAAVREYHARSS